jgi:hypothetical protein
MNRSKTKAAPPEPPRNDKGRCAPCNGVGKLADGTYCTCHMGRDLERVERRDKVQAAKKGPAAARRKRRNEEGPMTQPPCQWEDGFDAGLSGQPITACPYAPATANAWAWHSGFLEGKARRLRRATIGLLAFRSASPGTLP